MKSEKRWVALFLVIVGLWALVLASTLYPWLQGTEILVNTEINLTYITAPLLAFYLLYVILLISIYIVYLGVAGKVRNNQVKAQPAVPQNDLCSIVIPARDEATVIRRTILTCLKQTHRNLEVIVVCHNCSDDTFEQAKINDARVRAYELNTKEAGKGVALNFGVERCHGNYILVLDSDGLLVHDFIETALPMVQGEYAAVQGRYIPSNRNFSFVTRMLSLEGDLWSTPFMTIRSHFGNRTPLGGTGYIIRKDIL
ncbi:MAG TPA: glycosyltransferase family 2 protein, partial [Nitrososphaera sp.]|nr:glycosyltransferase family 2 protein [Nitrososphaera sp.]